MLRRSLTILSQRLSFQLTKHNVNYASSSGNGKQRQILSDAEWKKKLTNEQYRILRLKDTEYPGTGKYNKHFETGVYQCAGCGQELYDSASKFDSRCGWPAFSSSISSSVRRQTDADGYRAEILCANCDGHLGHVFEGEGLRDGNGKVVQERHCVNSASLQFRKRE
ncbi:unnamed protein product [Adineta ricciae]|uniref:Peptide-methionine (R)-S-oxide reductase n=1 Tax=Adineta ricciae TaxID=249248 RepID=A0A814HMT2_ADIRI|nr:unnamed protein product [Adineta ricciae]